MNLAGCSEKSKRVVRFLDLKAEYFQVVMNDTIGVGIEFNGSQWIAIHFPDNPLMNLPNKIKITQKINEVESITELNNIYPIKKWMQILMSMFHLRKIDNFLVCRLANLFNSETIYDLFKNLKIKDMIIEDVVPVMFTQQLAGHFSHVTEDIFAEDPFQHSGNRCAFLSQNFAGLHLHNTQNISVDELFLINSVEVYLVNLELSDKDINVFLKHWIMGSNLRLKKITMQMLRTNVNQNIVLKGINHQIVPDQQQGEEKYDIYRQDGTEATVHFQQKSLYTSFILTVSS